jgi:putative NADPH-quinone reductase
MKTRKKILLILAHSDEMGFCGRLFEAYKKGAERSGAELKTLKLGELHFDPILHRGYRETQELESDLKKAQELILWANHLVFIFPTWWSSFPAILKGFVDRVILPGFAFRFKEGASIPEKLLTGKTAHIITTMDAPAFVYRWYFGAPGVHILKKGVLQFCGISPVHTTLIGRVRFMSDKKKEKVISKIEKLAEKGR